MSFRLTHAENGEGMSAALLQKKWPSSRVDPSCRAVLRLDLLVVSATDHEQVV